MFNVTWTHLNQTVYANGRSLTDFNSSRTDQYHFMAYDGKGFRFEISQVTAPSVGYVGCFAEPIAEHSTSAVFEEYYFLYVELEPEDMFPRPMKDETVHRGESAIFECKVHFTLEKRDPCTMIPYQYLYPRFRWSHQGKYVFVPQYDENRARTPNNFRFLKYYPANSSDLVIRHTDKTHEGTVKCEVRWGPEPHHWVAQEARLYVN